MKRSISIAIITCLNILPPLFSTIIQPPPPPPSPCNTTEDDTRREEEEGEEEEEGQCSSSTPNPSPFQIIIDGGSTGSRLHVFEFIERSSPTQSEPNRVETAIVRRGSSRAWTPLTAYSPESWRKHRKETMNYHHEEDDGEEGRMTKNAYVDDPYNDDHVHLLGGGVGGGDNAKNDSNNNDDNDDDTGGGYPEYVSSHLISTFEYAASIIPSQYHSSTPVKYGATAGMRLLTLQEQKETYDGLYHGLINSILTVTVVGGTTGTTDDDGGVNEKDGTVVREEDGRGNTTRRMIPFPFTNMKPDDIATLDGQSEGLYGAIAANYLSGRIDADLHLTTLAHPGHPATPVGGDVVTVKDDAGIEEEEEECCSVGVCENDAVTAGEDGGGHRQGGNDDNDRNNHHHGPYGALDMGGSSTQLVFHPGGSGGGAGCDGDIMDSKGCSNCRITDDVVDSMEGEGERTSCSGDGGSNHGGRGGAGGSNDTDDNGRVGGGGGGAGEGEGGVCTSSSSTSPTSTTTVPPASSSSQPLSSSSSESNHKKKLNGDEFFSTSYLSYGVDQFRQRLWDTWIDDMENHLSTEKDTSSSWGRVIYNPCSFSGYTMEYDGYTFIGTGDSMACTNEVRRLLPTPRGGEEGGGEDIIINPATATEEEEEEEEPPIEEETTTTTISSRRRRRGRGRRIVGGIQHPPIRGKFYAMSLYFFTLDCLRELTPDIKAYRAINDSWPSPSIQELTDALDSFCARAWEGDLDRVIKDDIPLHAYTRPSVLPHRCIEAVYMVTLLRDGFGFHPESRDIIFAFDVDGSEVEWTLGMALSVRAAASNAAAAAAAAAVTDGGVGDPASAIDGNEQASSDDGEDADVGDSKNKNVGASFHMGWTAPPPGAIGSGEGGAGTATGAAATDAAREWWTWMQDYLFVGTRMRMQEHKRHHQHQHQQRGRRGGEGRNATSKEGSRNRGRGDRNISSNDSSSTKQDDDGEDEEGVGSAYFLDMYGYYSMESLR